MNIATFSAFSLTMKMLSSPRVSSTQSKYVLTLLESSRTSCFCHVFLFSKSCCGSNRHGGKGIAVLVTSLSLLFTSGHRPSPCTTCGTLPALCENRVKQNRKRAALLGCWRSDGKELGKGLSTADAKPMFKNESV